VYIDLVRLQMESGLTNEAFSTAERLRARSFLSQIESAGTPALSKEQRRTEMAMREKIRQLQAALTDELKRVRPERRQLAIDAYSSELMLAEHDYQAFLDDTQSRNFDVNTLEVPGIGEIQARLAPGQALVEFVLDEERIMSFVLRREGLFSLAVDVRRSNLVNQIALVRDLMQLPGSDRWAKPAHSLYKSLVLPLLNEGLLNDVGHIYLVPHGFLNYLPFALLPADADGRQLMIDRYTITYLPTAATLVRKDSHDAGRASMLALAPETTQLRYAPNEARSIAALFDDGAQLLEGPSATESAFKARAGDYYMLHIATHGFLNKSNPLLSGLALEADDSNDGLLQVHEILAVKLDARLVTLSACQTGLGSGYFNEIPAGDEFVGLTRAFLAAGSDSVLATLWEVDDRSTVDLMETFYQRFEEGNESNYATALADAQRSLRAGKKFNHPYYWAPFVLVGQHNQPKAQN
jgi:CHAT domain-containing protein